MPHVAEVTVTGQKYVSADQHFDLHVDGRDAIGTRQVVDENDQLHPTLPFVSLVAMQDFGEAAVLSKEKPKHEDVAHRDPEAELRVVFVLFHEEVGAIAKIEIGHNNGQC